MGFNLVIIDHRLKVFNNWRLNVKLHIKVKTKNVSFKETLKEMSFLLSVLILRQKGDADMWDNKRVSESEEYWQWCAS